MTINIHAEGTERKRLVHSISNWLGHPAKYCGAPTFNFEVGGFTIGKTGSLSFDDGTNSDVVERLLQHLYEEGFDLDMRTMEPEAAEEPETPAEETSSSICISMPRSLFTESNLAVLQSIITAKKNLICKALGTSDLPLEITDEKVSFPWFPGEPDADSIKAYDAFICRLCDMARNQKRSTAKEKPVDNEKYAFRCFLLRLGFIGDEYKTERKILLRNLTGSSAFKAGARKEATCDEISQ